MHRRFWAVVAIGFTHVLGLAHCGGTAEVIDVANAAGASGRPDSSRAGQPARAGSGGSSAVTPDAGFGAYDDPGCPDAGPAVEINECDPFATEPGCDPGEGCFPFVSHPYGDGCGAQSFGARCRRAGEGRQGDVCGNGSGRCAAGFVCVVGSQPGMHCVQLCRMGVQKVCPAGLVCGELDVEGYGVCS